MTDCRPIRVPRTEPDPDREANRHAAEVRYWAAYFNEFVSLLPGIRRRRGDEPAERLAGDVLTELCETKGRDAAILARDRLSGRLARAAAEVAGVSARRVQGEASRRITPCSVGALVSYRRVDGTCRLVPNYRHAWLKDGTCANCGLSRKQVRRS